MSRISEALKKAELEASAATALSETPRERQMDSPKPENLMKLAEIGLPPPPSAPLDGAGLQFEDISKSCVHVSWRPDPAKNVFANQKLGSEAAEEFRTLRSRLYQLQAERPLRVVLVTSPISGEGKTFVASNLAQAIARQADRRVLLIDADLRSPDLHMRLGAPLNPGLGEYLTGSADAIDVIQHGKDGGLYFIAAGMRVSNASELLSSTRLKALIEHTAPCFDWVILDSPPCLPLADAGVIAALSDGIILVVRSGRTPSSAANKAQHELRKRNVIGVVFNGVDAKTLRYGSYYGRGLYGTKNSDEPNQLSSI